MKKKTYDDEGFVPSIRTARAMITHGNSMDEVYEALSRRGISPTLIYFVCQIVRGEVKRGLIEAKK